MNRVLTIVNHKAGGKPASCLWRMSSRGYMLERVEGWTPCLKFSWHDEILLQFYFIWLDGIYGNGEKEAKPPVHSDTIALPRTLVFGMQMDAPRCWESYRSFTFLSFPLLPGPRAPEPLSSFTQPRQIILNSSLPASFTWEHPLFLRKGLPFPSFCTLTHGSH